MSSVRFPRPWRGILFLCLSMPGVGHAAELSMVFGQSLAPYADERSGKGVEIDIVRAALAASGHSLRIAFVPQARVLLALSAGQYDAAATSTPESGVAASYREPYLFYRDYAIAAKGRYPYGPTIADLGRLQVVGFQNAPKYLGTEFARVTRSKKGYREHADQMSQVCMLFGGNADVMGADRLIFMHQTSLPQASQRFKERPFEVDISPLFEKIPSRAAFRDPAQRDDFDRGLAIIRKMAT